MDKNQLKIFAPSKVNIDHQKVNDYLKGKPIFPTTIELDLTQLCSRACPGCPYGSSRKAGLTLQIPFLDRLFSILGPNTPGIVFSGGESTIVPHFPKTLSLARKKGFREIAVISNGANIHLSPVQDALLRNATSIRISLYDWQEHETDSFRQTLRKIEDMRKLIDREGSDLEIGASILTRKEWNHRYLSVGLRALDAGIHWLYFHPYCIDWDKKRPVQADQSDVLSAISLLKDSAPEANIQVPFERYDDKPLHFDEMHGSHFLIQVGADGKNYVGPECKYETDAELLNLNDYLEDDFLWQPGRTERLHMINSGNYRFIGTKHRPPMFSDYIQQLIDSNTVSTVHDASFDRFSYPSII